MKKLTVSFAFYMTADPDKEWRSILTRNDHRSLPGMGIAPTQERQSLLIRNEHRSK